MTQAKPPKVDAKQDKTSLSHSPISIRLSAVNNQYLYNLYAGNLYRYNTTGLSFGLVYRHNLEPIIKNDLLLEFSADIGWGLGSKIRLLTTAVQVLLKKRFGNLEVGAGYLGSFADLTNTTYRTQNEDLSITAGNLGIRSGNSGVLGSVLYDINSAIGIEGSAGITWDRSSESVASFRWLRASVVFSFR